jgi:hypothetical protein
MSVTKQDVIRRIEEMSTEEFTILQKLFSPDNTTRQQPLKPLTTFEIVTNYLKELGFAANIRGYERTRTALLIMIEEPNTFNHSMTQLYKLVGEKTNSSSGHAERNIRHAIIKAAKENPEKFAHFSNRPCPKVSEFLYAAADALKLKV